MSQQDERPTLEPVTQQFIDSLAAGAALPAEARAWLVGAQSTPTGKPRVVTEDLVLAVGPTGSVDVRIVRPPGVDGALPIVMLFHGGGSMLGDRDTHDRFMREIAVGAGAAIVFVGYERVPERAYPVAVEQAYAAMVHVVGQAATLRLDQTRLAVIGDGVGGGIAASVVMMAKERRGPRIEYQVLLYPVTDACFDTPSYRLFAEGPWLTREAMMGFWDAYLPDRSARGDKRATPLSASLAALRGLPDALVIVAESDVLRDEGEAYARKLSDAGVRVTSMRYNGTIHDFALLHALADTPAARSAMGQIILALKSALH